MFAALAGGDYGLWKWALAGNHQVLAIVCGLTLPPLALAFAWLLVVSAWRLFSEATSRPQGLERPVSERPVRVARSQRPVQRLARARRRTAQPAATSAAGERPPRKLVA